MRVYNIIERNEIVMRKAKPVELNKIEHNFLSSIGDGGYMWTFHPNEVDNKKYSFNNERIKRACTALVLYSEIKNVDEVAKIMGLNRKTIYNYIKAYRDDPNFMKKSPVTNVSELQAYVSQIAADFKTAHIKTIKEAKARIKELTGIERGTTQIRSFLKNNYFAKNAKGYYYQKTSRQIKRQLEERKKKVKNHSYLETHSNEVEEFTYMIANSYDYRVDKIAKRIKEKFKLREPMDEIEKWLDMNTSIKKNVNEDLEEVEYSENELNNLFSNKHL